jgi:phosphatidylglycerol:prolipoprotein diacylglycerol transferase
MSSHGGILGVVLVSLYYARRHKLSWTNLGDNLVVAVPIGLFLGRCANFINGELYGRAATIPWAMQFPKELLEPANAAEADRVLTACQQINPSLNSIESFTSKIEMVIESIRTSPQVETILRGILTPRHPSQLYEAFLEGVVLFAILWFVRTRMRTPNGLLTGLFMICYSIFRIVVEYFREPDAPMIGMFTRGQFFSFFVIVLGVGFIVAAKRRPTYPRQGT